MRSLALGSQSQAGLSAARGAEVFNLTSGRRGQFAKVSPAALQPQYRPQGVCSDAGLEGVRRPDLAARPGWRKLPGRSAGPPVSW